MLTLFRLRISPPHQMPYTAWRRNGGGRKLDSSNRRFWRRRVVRPLGRTSAGQVSNFVADRLERTSYRINFADFILDNSEICQRPST